MKTKITTLILLMALSFGVTYAQDQTAAPYEKYGNTFNIGAGIGYYGYIGHPVPVLNLSYEFDVARSFTLAPFVGIYTTGYDYYYGNPQDGYRYYNYRETVVPVGLKGTYYFDRLLNAGPRWDFYAAASIGFAIVSSSWDADYPGDRNVYAKPSPLFLDAHIGARFHMTGHVGAFLDLSTGVSTIGLSFH
jgi:hypothetical protein